MTDQTTQPIAQPIAQPTPPSFAAALKATYPDLSEHGAIIQLEFDSGIPRDTLDLYLDGLPPGPRHAAKIEKAADARAARRAKLLAAEFGVFIEGDA